MSTLEQTQRPSRRLPAPLQAGDDDFVELAATVGRVAKAHGADHDRDATFVTEAYEAMGEHRYLALAVPTELGGLGASMRQVCYAQAELARADGAAALAATMHHYNVLVQAYRWRHGAEDASRILERVAAGEAVIATSGGSDWLRPSTLAEPVDGGFRVSGRKVFCSQAPVATVMTTSAVVGEPGPDAEVIHFGLPLATDGVRMVETWDTLGMRGTASHDLVLEDVFVPEGSIVARRQYGQFHPALFGAVIHFAPVGGATYWGIAAEALDAAVDAAAVGVTRTQDVVTRQIGLADTRLRVGWWSLLGAVAELGDDYALDAANMSMVMTAKREAVLAAREAVDLAMAVVGGSSYFRASSLERAHRDVFAGAFHPLDPETTVFTAGRVALDRPVVDP